MLTNITPFLKGFGTGASLIMAIGAQNAFVLKQGICKNYVFVTVFICALIDALLICAGVMGFGRLISSNPLVLEIARWGGALFLIIYGLKSWHSVFKVESLKVDLTSELPNFSKSILILLAMSLLNPHVYLDTVILLGSIGTQFPDCERPYFIIGAIISSFVWFFALGYGARYLAPLFKNPLSWKILDGLIGCVMFLIAYSLIFGDMGGKCS